MIFSAKAIVHFSVPFQPLCLSTFGQEPHSQPFVTHKTNVWVPKKLQNNLRKQWFGDLGASQFSSRLNRPRRSKDRQFAFRFVIVSNYKSSRCPIISRSWAIRGCLQVQNRRILNFNQSKWKDHLPNCLKQASRFKLILSVIYLSGKSISLGLVHTNNHGKEW